MNDLPEWLVKHLRASPDARSSAKGLLFHGTVEPFEGRLVASNWERLRWFAESPEVAQSYCPESGSTVFFGFPSYSLDQAFVPHTSFAETIITAMGFDVEQMEATRDRYQRMDSYRLLPNHPTNGQAKSFLEDMGYVFEDEAIWIKVRMREVGGDEIMPADWKMPGRLFIAERPTDLRLYDLQSNEDGGLTGRQWMRTDLFERLASSGLWDGIIIDDIHQSKKLGQFGHRSIGLFQPAMDRLRMHEVDSVSCEPWDVWQMLDGSTTPEFDRLRDMVATRMAA